MERMLIALAGGFGGIAPSLVELARRLQTREIAPWLGSQWTEVLFAIGFSLLAMALFFFIGAAVALIYREEVLSKAMLLGIGAPALIMAANAAGGQEGPPQRVAELSLISQAHAQDSAPPGKGFDLTVKPAEADGNCAACSIAIFGKDQQLLVVQAIDQNGAGTTVDVPDNADRIVLTGANTNAVTIAAESLTETAAGQPDDPVVLDLARDRNYWNDFYRVLGNKSVQPYDFKLELQK